jgi:hypothetical protein
MVTMTMTTMTIKHVQGHAGPEACLACYPPPKLDPAYRIWMDPSYVIPCKLFVPTPMTVCQERRRRREVRCVQARYNFSSILQRRHMVMLVTPKHNVWMECTLRLSSQSCGGPSTLIVPTWRRRSVEPITKRENDPLDLSSYYYTSSFLFIITSIATSMFKLSNNRSIRHLI